MHSLVPSPTDARSESPRDSGPSFAPASHPFAPQVENRLACDIAGPPRIVAFNAKSGAHFDGILRCLRRGVLKSASILLLCEVDSGTRRVHGRRVAADLARELGMSCAYQPQYELRHRDGVPGGWLGVAILSATPVLDASTILVPDPALELMPKPREFKLLRRIGAPVGLRVRVELRGKPFDVAVAHLHSRCAPAGRELQMKAIVAALGNRGPAIIGGDFNTTTTELGSVQAMRDVVVRMLRNPARFRHPQASEPLFDRLREAGFSTDDANAEGRGTFTFSRLVPPLFRPKLDWIALREIQPVDATARVIRAQPTTFSPRVSDHDFVSVDIHV
ncbi:MAG TPA: endonuclease/exonuclease/phosphatase family protein [Candidatus Binataceae bacterium]|nr:endonuclease/exonuclease/phosphatase family protein [Candidatus Binataceae bacterium]